MRLRHEGNRAYLALDERAAIVIDRSSRTRTIARLGGITMDFDAARRAADAERAALEPRHPHVLLERDPCELLLRVARAGDPDPIRRLRPEPLSGGQRDVLGRAVGLRDDALPDPLRRALDLLDLGGGLHVA